HQTLGRDQGGNPAESAMSTSRHPDDPESLTSMDPIISPITGLIDKVEELLGHSPHPAIVTVPIGAWAVSNIADSLAILTGDDRYDDIARVSMAVGLVGGVGAAITGLRDYSFIDPKKPSHDTATAHGLGNAVVMSLFTASYLIRQRDHSAGRPAGLLSRALALSGGSLALYTAWLGGVLVEEYGEAVKPVMNAQDDHDHDDGKHGRERLSPGTPLGSFSA
ncbi:MAG: DUF2231 domain-containing protein, partial [Planctomycetia bacterium]|nr:DUF2231 domain-containing protein [Planctomycetia bacterium]